MKEKESQESDLRRRAEEKLHEDQPPKGSKDTPEDNARLVQELQIHQIELELQNEELRMARAATEAALNRSIHLYDFAPVGYFTLDRKGVIIEANQTGASLLGLARDRVLNHLFRNLIALESDLAFNAFLDGVFNSEDKQVCDVALRKKRETPSYARIEGCAVESNVGGRQCRMVMTDITERKQAEDALLESEAGFRAMFNAARDAMLVVDDSGVCLSANAATETIFRLSGDELEGQSVAPLFGSEPVTREQTRGCNPLSEAGFKEMWAKFLRKGVFSLNYELVRSDRPVLRIESYGVARILPKRHLVVFRDMTERERLVGELERSNKDLGHFAYIASHDLQEPLRQIIGFVEIIDRKFREKLGEEGTEYMDFVVDGATRMRSLIQNLLAYSRVGGPDLKFTPTDMHKALERALADLRGPIKESGAVITHDPMPTLNAHPGQLAQVFQNLIGNAIKFCKGRQPEIHIGVERKNDCWLFSVRDNGIGFESEFADSVFQIFKRLHTRDEYEGTGIGLAICRKVIERHGGEIWAEAEPEKGATFYFTLPAS